MSPNRDDPSQKSRSHVKTGTNYRLNGQFIQMKRHNHELFTKWTNPPKLR